MQPVDLQRLIQIIVEEVAAAQSAPAPSRCACHDSHISGNVANAR